MGDDPTGRARKALLAIVCPEGSTCWLCGQPIIHGLRRWHPRGPSMDHVIPRSHGGTWDLRNLRPAHYGCNSARGNGPPKRATKINRSREW